MTRFRILLALAAIAFGASLVLAWEWTRPLRGDPADAILAEAESVRRSLATATLVFVTAPAVVCGAYAIARLRRAGSRAT
jgi:hypothetical protein